MIPLLALLLVSPADAGRRDRLLTPPPPPERPVPVYALNDTPTTPGSLWAEVPARRLMGLDGAARQIGDLVTVQITEATSTSLDATTGTSRKNKTSMGITAMLGAESTITSAHPNMGGAISIGADSDNSFTGAGATARSAKLESTLTCEVVDVLPTGNLRIWGWKQVRVNREVQYVVIDGIVRPRDIQMDNTVESQLLAQAKIEITGSGVIADRQGPGWGARLLDAIWPF